MNHNTMAESITFGRGSEVNQPWACSLAQITSKATPGGGLTCSRGFPAPRDHVGLRTYKISYGLRSQAKGVSKVSR